MKTEVKKIDEIKRQINVEVSGEIVKNKFADVFSKIAKEANVAGFRVGHAPLDIIEKNFSSQAHQQVIQELVPDIYHQAIQKEGLEAVGLPDIFDVQLEKELLSFKANLEVAPEIKLKNYKGLKVNYKKIEVTPEELKRNIDSIKESRKIDTADDNLARSLGYPNLQELEQALEKQIYIQKENVQRYKIENDIIEQVAKDLDFKLPPSLVNRQLEEMLRQAKVDLALKGIPREKIEEQEAKLRTELEAEAKKEIKIYLILAEIAKKEKLNIDEHLGRRVMEFLLKEADWKAS